MYCVLLPGQVCEEEDNDQYSQVGIGPDGVDILVHLCWSSGTGLGCIYGYLISSQASRVTYKILGQEWFRGADFFEESIAAKDKSCLLPVIQHLFNRSYRVCVLNKYQDSLMPKSSVEQSKY